MASRTAMVKERVLVSQTVVWLFVPIAMLIVVCVVAVLVWQRV